MGALLNLFLDICLLRKGPQDVPASPALLKASLAAYGLASLLVQAVSVNLLTALLQAFLDLGLLAGLTYAVLQATGFSGRFTQTLTALAGTGALLGFAILPVTIWMDRDLEAGIQSGLPALLFFGWLIWSIAVVAHVLRHALSTSMAMASL
jgi:hypothetical protein